MRQHSPQLLEVLSGSFTRRLFVYVFHGSDRLDYELAFESWSLDGDLGSAVALSGSGTVVHQSTAGESLTPVGTKGVLSPFRARLELVMEISAGQFVERVSLGIFRVESVPEARDFTADVNGQETVIASRVTVKLLSLAEDIRRWGFRFPESPPSFVSCYEELRRITEMPVEETVPDQPIPASTVWEAKQGGRLEAVQTLADILGGVAVVNSVGAWEIVPDEVGEPVATIRLGVQGTVLDVGNDIETDTVYNEVVGIFEDEKRRPIHAVAEVTTGDLRVDGPYGRHTRYYASDLVNTSTQAQTAVQSILDLSIGSQMYDVAIQCHVNPLIELGDVVELVGWTRPLVGRVVTLSMDSGALMNVSLRVHRDL